MTLEQLGAYFGAIVLTCGILASLLPQNWRITKLLTKIGALTVRAVTKIPPTVVLLVVFATQGCAGTFEEAKIAGRQAHAAAPSPAASTPARCQSLSEREYWFTGTGLGLVAVGAAAASLALPIESKTVETILIAGGTTATVTGGGLTWFGTSAGVNYVREGCTK